MMENVIVAIKERSAGNDTVGDMWLETKIFSQDTPVGDILFWANKKSTSGKLIITKPEID